MSENAPRVSIESRQALRDWLEANHDKSGSIWLVTWKKNSGHPSVTYDEIVEECLAFGWIDSQSRKLDDQRSMLRLSPRNPKSNWSASNKRRVARLQKAGLMHEAGRRQVALAKKSGTWTFLDDVERLEVPDDLALALETMPDARAKFDRFPDSSKRGILEWIKSAKRADTRARRIEETAEKAARNRKANHPAGRDAGPKPGER